MEGECEMGDIEIVKEKPIEILISEIQNLRQELYNIKNDVSFIKHFDTEVSKDHFCVKRPLLCQNDLSILILVIYN